MLPELLVQYLSNGRTILPRLSAWQKDQQLCLHLSWHRLAKPSVIPLQQFFTKGFQNKRVVWQPAFKEAADSRSYNEPYIVLYEVQHAACDDGFTEIVIVCGPPPLKPPLPSSRLTIFWYSQLFFYKHLPQDKIAQTYNFFALLCSPSYTIEYSRWAPTEPIYWCALCNSSIRVVHTFDPPRWT